MITREEQTILKKEMFEAFENAISSGVAVAFCPTCKKHRSYPLKSDSRAYHWVRGQIIDQCDNCLDINK